MINGCAPHFIEFHHEPSEENVWTWACCFYPVGLQKEWTVLSQLLRKETQETANCGIMKAKERCKRECFGSRPFYQKHGGWRDALHSCKGQNIPFLTGASLSCLISNPWSLNHCDMRLCTSLLSPQLQSHTDTAPCILQAILARYILRCLVSHPQAIWKSAVSLQIAANFILSNRRLWQ